MLASQRKKRQESLEERAAAATQLSQKQLQSEIDELTETLQKLRIEFDASKSRFRLNEKRLKDIIASREDEITSLKSDIEQLTVKYTKVQSQLEDLSRTRTSAKKKKKKKHKEISEKPLEESPVQDGTKSTDDRDGLIEESPVQDGTKSADGRDDFILEERLKTNEEDKEVTIPSSKQEDETVGKTPQQREKDKEAIEVIKKHGDLIQQPQEEWLSRHLQEKYDGKDRIESYSTSTNGKKYDPLGIAQLLIRNHLMSINHQSTELRIILMNEIMMICVIQRMIIAIV